MCENKKRSVLVALVLLFLLVEVRLVFAQNFPRPGSAPRTNPAWSPYLNLYRRGNTPAFNYFSLVKPELQFRQDLQVIQQRYNDTQRELNSLADQQLNQNNLLPQTGHASGFMTQGRYFMNMGGSGRTGAGIGVRGFSNTSGMSSRIPASAGMPRTFNPNPGAGIQSYNRN